MKKYSELFSYGISIVCGLLLSLCLAIVPAQADQNSQMVSKEKTIQKVFNKDNPVGNVDLKSIVEQELVKPEECNQPLMVCQIQEVDFNITLKKQWLKQDITQLNSYDFANAVPLLKNPINQLTKPEIVVMQETLAKRGLLQNLDGSIVKARGFMGPLTSLALLRLAQVKKLDPKNPNFNTQLRDQVNKLLKNMAKDKNYLTKNTLPTTAQMTPKPGDPLSSLWNNGLYLAQLAQKGSPVDPGKIPLNSSVDVNIDGFVNVTQLQNQ